MKILYRLTIKNLLLNKRRTIVTIIGIILSGAMICGVAAIAVSSQDLLIRATLESNGNYHATFLNVSMDNTKYVKNNPYTKAWMLSRDIGLSELENPSNEKKPFLLIKSYDKVAFTNMPIQLVEGRLPEKYGEIVVTEDLFKQEGAQFRIGNRLILNIGDMLDSQLNINATEAYTITGHIKRPRFENSSSKAHTAIAFLDEAYLSSSDKVNISILGKNPKQIFVKGEEIFVAAAAEKVTYNNELLKWKGISSNDTFNNVFGTLALIIILLVVIGSVSVIYNAFAISVSERKKQFGMLASVGSTPMQIRRMVFFEGFILGIISIPLGIISGFLGIGITLKVVNRLMIESLFVNDISLRLVISPIVILTTIVFVSLTIFFSAYFPARKASKISPIEAIRLTTDIRVTGKKLKNWRITRYLFGMEGELALKTLKRNSKRYRATVFSLFISIVLFVSFSSFLTYGFISSDLYYGEIPFDMVFYVHHNEASHKEANDLLTSIAKLEEIERYSIQQTLNSTVSIGDISLFGQYIRKQIKENNIIPKSLEGNYHIGINIISLKTDDYNQYLTSIGVNPIATSEVWGILVNKNILGGRIEYEPLNIEVGEKLPINTVSPSINLEIAGITDKIPFGGTYTSMSTISVIVKEEVYNVILEAHPGDLPNRTYSHLAIKTNEVIEVSNRVKDFSHYKGYEALGFSDISTIKREMERTKVVMGIFLYGFVSLITLIGVTNIFNTISTNMALRRREFAMLKSVGLTPEGFNKMINYESIFYGLKALLYGLPISTLISVWMYNTIGSLFVFEFVLPWKEIFVCIIGVFIIVFLTMMYSSRKLKKENIIDALKEENL